MIKIQKDYNNITINNCSINSNKSPLLLNGTNISITNNTFTRKSNRGGILNFININEIYGTTNINNNTMSDTIYRYGFDNCVEISTTNTKTGTLNINNNTVTNVKRSILKFSEYSIDSNKLTININNNTVNTKMNIIPIYTTIRTKNDFSNINLINFKNNTITGTNTERNRTYNGIVYLAKDIYTATSVIYLFNVIGKIVFDNNSFTNLTINMNNYYGHNAYNTKVQNNLITTNFNVKNENYVLVSEPIYDSFYYDDLYSIINTRLVNSSNYNSYNVNTSLVVSNLYANYEYLVTIDDLTFNQRSNIAYQLLNNKKTFAKFSITVLSDQGIPITNFSLKPINISMSLPNADKNNVLKLYKINSSTGLIIEPQPTNFPKNVSYNETTGKWSWTLSSLSSYAIVDETIEEKYDFVLKLKTDKTNLFDIFSDAYYLNNGDGSSNIILNVNKTFIKDRMKLNKTSIITENSDTSIAGFESGYKMFGSRMLEIIALKIFGHPQARAAISNDTKWYKDTLISDIVNSASNSFNEKTNEIFDLYKIGNNFNSIYEQNINFDFTNTYFDIPFYLTGSLGPSISNEVANGPNMGGSVLVNGLYNVPLILRFY